MVAELGDGGRLPAEGLQQRVVVDEESYQLLVAGVESLLQLGWQERLAGDGLGVSVVGGGLGVRFVGVHGKKGVCF